MGGAAPPAVPPPGLRGASPGYGERCFPRRRPCAAHGAHHGALRAARCWRLRGAHGAPQGQALSSNGWQHCVRRVCGASRLTPSVVDELRRRQSARAMRARALRPPHPCRVEKKFDFHTTRCSLARRCPTEMKHCVIFFFLTGFQLCIFGDILRYSDIFILCICCFTI